MLETALDTIKSIEMSRQLYVLSGILELYYSQNYEQAYIDYIQDDMISYVNKSDHQILAVLGIFHGKVTDYIANPLEKTEGRKEYLNRILKLREPYDDGNDSPLRIALEQSLESIHNKAEFFISGSGEMYIRKVS
ncbi:MAG: hypothetical protein IJX90_10650 [Blautia sp.]|nr:hypothetical protein [Blautia sp.]